ncbi:hypothetical protein ONE63_005575 [Megalurothrips usitatus]|uniref:Coiled-coil domain-containing protein 112-like n=1 Tax=Megalurothrips usitatus TaxID=439358 RepID=A0AAV7Y258_9NEOP|nr:hypothetical protein ONE63_005575 [Megalurothrips usitatus]
MRPDRGHKVETNLVAQQEVFERAYSTLLNGLKHVDQKYVDHLKSAHSETEAHRKKEEQNVLKSLFAIVMVIQKLRHNIRNEQFVEQHDTEYFKDQLTSIEKNLSSFKNILSEQLLALQEEEKDLQQSIESLQQRLNDTSGTTKKHVESSFSSAVRERAKSRTFSQIDSNIHPDVKEFQQFLQHHGGHTGGWAAKDHLLFTRFLQKYKGLDQMTTALLDFMPDKTPEEIAEHESWYHDYLTLKDAHRKALKEWRDEQVSNKKGCEMVMESARSDLSTSAAPIKQTNQRDPSVKEKIRAWKEQQQKIRQIQLQELQEKRNQEKELWRKKVAYFENQRRKTAEKRKEQNNVPSSEDPKEQEIGVRTPIKQIPLKDFWEQDKLFMLRRQSRLQRFTASPQTRPSSQSTGHAERDPTRLLRPTAVWRARVKRSLSEDGHRQPQGPHGPLYIADVPHLAIPKWREGLV